MAENKERLLTPEEMYQAAYKRNIAIGEMWLKTYPQPTYSADYPYTFDFDPTSKYQLLRLTRDGGIIFIRVHDGAKAIFTKYSHITFY